MSFQMNNAANITRRSLEPVQFVQTLRPDYRTLNTSARAGKVYPAAFIPLFPNDEVKAGSQFTLGVFMEETVKELSNAVHVRARADFVSYAALDRFDGMDAVAYGHAGKAGAPAIYDPTTYAAATHDEFYHAIGEHFKEGEEFDQLYHQAYNCVVNWRRQTASNSLPTRLESDTTLARALWGSTAIAGVVPNFDEALLTPSTELQFSGEQLALTGTAEIHKFLSNAASGVNNQTTYNEDGTIAASGAGNPQKPLHAYYDGTEWQTGLVIEDFSNVFAELAGNAGTVSIARIDQARKLQSFAKLRQRLAGNDDEIIDLLMRGIVFPRSTFLNPIQIGAGTAVIGVTKRYATDAANLQTYVTNGQTMLNLPLAMPKQETGGVIVVTYEIVPEPVYDRMADLFLRTRYVDRPNALRDTLDDQPVKEVPNRFVDALHTSPEGVFGYAPMNYQWARRRIGVGGRFLRTLASLPTDEDQAHIWGARTVDPELTEDTFLVTADLPHNVFRDFEADPFLIQANHSAVIQGDTVFPPAILESYGDYEAVAAVVPNDTIVSPDPNA